ncbi:hypothetical protein PseBG33_0206 [Pseudomonas synxantha BG33R]|nr:hypothetical protein PseBG33_0206 [Pseudomonas synxantha BG33R]
MNGIITVLTGVKKLNTRTNKDTQVEKLTIGAIKAELDFIDLQLKRKSG